MGRTKTNLVEFSTSPTDQAKYPGQYRYQLKLSPSVLTSAVLIHKRGQELIKDNFVLINFVKGHDCWHLFLSSIHNDTGALLCGRGKQNNIYKLQDGKIQFWGNGSAPAAPSKKIGWMKMPTMIRSGCIEVRLPFSLW